MSTKRSSLTTRLEKTVFISYRRKSVAWALAIYQSLTHSGYDVFFDYEGVGSGDFERVILENVRARAHFLVLLTPSALERIDEPQDWLRREIEVALDTKRNVVPLMLEGFDFGTAGISEHLTGSLARLTRYNGLQIVPAYFAEGMERLRTRRLSVPLASVVHPPSEAASVAARVQQAAAAAAPQVEERELTAAQWYERGRDTKDPEEKIRRFSEALRLNPADVFSYVDRAEARFKVGDREGAWADYEKAILIDPNEEYIFWSRASTRLNAGELYLALDDSDRAVFLAPDDSYNRTKRADVLEALGRLPEAIAECGEAIRLSPERALAYYHRGKALEAIGDKDAANSDYDTAIRFSKDTIESYLTHHARGDVRAAQKDFQGALADYNESIRLDPKTAYRYLDRARLHADMGDSTAAIADCEACLALQPPEPYAAAVARLLTSLRSGA